MFLDFFSPATDMRLKSVTMDSFADSWVLIALVQTKRADTSRQTPVAHFMGTLQSLSHQAAVMNVSSSCRYPQRDTLTVHMQVDLTATTPSVGRIAAETFNH